MSSDKLVFDLANETEKVPDIFIKKDWVNILDNQNGVYSSNTSVLDTSQLSNSNKYMNYREAYLAIPMLLSVATTANTANFAPNTAATSADHAVGLKSWFGQIIHSFTLDIGGVTVVQQTPFCNMWNSFKLLTSMSWADVTTEGATMGFYPDDPLSFSYHTANSVHGRGVCNNTNASGNFNTGIGSANAFGVQVSGSFNEYKSDNGNIGLLKRQQYINYDPDGVSGNGTYGANQLSATASTNLWKSYINRKVNGAAGAIGSFQTSIMAFVHLRHIHSFFNYIPLVKGVYMKMTMFLNNTTVEFVSTGVGAAYSLSSVNNAVGGVCPIMLASAQPAALNAAPNASFVPQGASACWGAATYRVNLSVGMTCLDSVIAGVSLNGPLSRNIILYVPAYSFNPIYEQAYLSSPIKTINYTDIYQYQILNVGATNQVNSLITNGIAGLKSCLVIPFYSASSNAVLGGGGFLPAYQSPFDPAGTGCTSPLCLLSNFNVVVSGQNAIYNTERYSFEQFINQNLGVNAVGGGQLDGMASGLIDQLGFEMEYCFHYVNIERALPVELSIPKSVQIIGQNNSPQALDLWVFLEYNASISLDILTGSRV
jgi:hypothetical protein